MEYNRQKKYEKIFSKCNVFTHDGNRNGNS